MQKKTFLDSLKAQAQVLKKIMEENTDSHDSTRGCLSPDGIKYYNQLANEFNGTYSDHSMYIFQEDTMPSQMDYPKSIEVLAQIEMAIRFMESTMQQKKAKVFISHSGDDKDYVKYIVDLLEDVGLTNEQLFCSSASGYGIPLNEDIYDYLKQQFQIHNLFVIFVLSKNYYNSVACMNEMGAAWVLQNSYTTILLPSFEFKEIKGAINPRQISLKLDSDLTEVREKLGQLKDILTQEFGLSNISDVRWEKKREDFIEKIRKWEASKQTISNDAFLNNKRLNDEPETLSITPLLNKRNVTDRKSSTKINKIKIYDQVVEIDNGNAGIALAKTIELLLKKFPANILKIADLDFVRVNDAGEKKSIFRATQCISIDEHNYYIATSTGINEKINHITSVCRKFNVEDNMVQWFSNERNIFTYKEIL
ncbi:hypothetical protein SDC9_69475 [bioreactor metagenome]|uniref:TIR domain-containing protein n=1 Tax=bioreactor metagenome TaxID=1076179 RepID=A0A644Y8W0_9ZZZZ